MHKLRHGRPMTRNERFHEVFGGVKESRRPLLFGQLIIMVVYLPIFAPDRGRREDVPPDGVLPWSPHLLGAMILSVTFIPQPWRC